MRFLSIIHIEVIIILVVFSFGIFYHIMEFKYLFEAGFKPPSLSPFPVVVNLQDLKHS